MNDPGCAMNGRGLMISLGQIYRDDQNRPVRVSYLFDTTEGIYCSLRDPQTDAALGNRPASDLEAVGDDDTEAKAG